MVRLEREQEELLEGLVEAHRAVPRDQRDKFLLLETMGGASIIHPGLSGWTIPSNRGDVEILGRYGLLALDYSSRSLRFVVTPEGLDHYDHLKKERAGQIEQVAEEIHRYLESAAFESRYPAAFSKWASAQRDLWSSDSSAQLTAIGHGVREAMQAFATESLVHFHVEPTDANPAHDVARIRFLLDSARLRLGDTEAAFLEALLAYWGVVSDLAQRQEHGAQKEGDSLTWEDARRLVFQAAVVMYEVDRAMTRGLARRSRGA